MNVDEGVSGAAQPSPPSDVPADRSTDVSEPRKPYACGGCDARWSGVSRCHCSRCHHTFAGSALFDKHQHLRNDAGYCDDPATMTNRQTGERLTFQDDNGVWGSVENPAVKRAPVRHRRPAEWSDQ